MSSAARKFGRVATLCGVCVLGTAACTVDSRVLHRRQSETGDAQTAESGLPMSGGPSLHLVDSGPVDYTDAGELPPVPSSKPRELDAGPCMHTDIHGNPDCSQTLAVNADFNRTIQAWDVAQGAVVRWVDFDSNSARGSGSMAVKNGLVGDLD